MIRADQIPDEVVEAAKTTYTAEIYKGQATAREYHEAMRSAIAAALNAWPNIERAKWSDRTFILPLPQEVSDEKSTTEEGRA